MAHTLQEIAGHIGGRVHPESAARQEASGIASIASAKPGDVVFVEDAKHLPRALASGASAVIVHDGVAGEHAVAAGRASKPFIVVEHPKLGFARAATFLQDPPRRMLGVHATALLDPTAKLGLGASVGPYAVIGARVTIGARTQVGSGVKIGDDVQIGADCVLHASVTVYRSTKLGDRTIVHSGAVLGADGFGYVRDPGSGRYEKFPQVGRLEIGNDVEIGANTTVDRGALDATVIGDGVKLDNLVHVGHNVRIGKNVVIAAQTGISGSSVIEDDVLVGGQVGIADHVTIASGVVLGAQCGVPSGKAVRGTGLFWGTPARPIARHLKELTALARLAKGK